MFNDQSLVSVGGRWNSGTNRVEKPFLGVMTAVTYNSLRPLEAAAGNDPKVSKVCQKWSERLFTVTWLFVR